MVLKPNYKIFWTQPIPIPRCFQPKYYIAELDSNYSILRHVILISCLGGEMAVLTCICINPKASSSADHVFPLYSEYSASAQAGKQQ